jgi:hypothetical protein
MFKQCTFHKLNRSKSWIFYFNYTKSFLKWFFTQENYDISKLYTLNHFLAFFFLIQLSLNNSLLQFFYKQSVTFIHMLFQCFKKKLSYDTTLFLSFVLELKGQNYCDKTWNTWFEVFFPSTMVLSFST